MEPNRDNEIMENLQNRFGFDSFLDGQETVIRNLLMGRDTLAVMPTGAGKSLCYQLPALLMKGITLVISPLISLMKNQVDVLIESGVPAVQVTSADDPVSYSEKLRGIEQGKYKILYIAPERLETEGFQQLLQRLPVSFLAIDEAHCISTWGHDFRPSYRAIRQVIESLPHRPVIGAFTATATDRVKEDIQIQLNMKSPLVQTLSYDRPNLYFSVKMPERKFDFLLDHLNQESSSIVYCATRKIVDEVYDELKRRGLPVAKYHAGLPDAVRQGHQEDFLYDKKTIMVATIAFGMGIDKSNVREVIHFNLSKSIENYYQEAGRAGRDGEPADAILLYSKQDEVIQRRLIQLGENQEEGYRKLQEMSTYANSYDCLRNQILRYFGEEPQEACRNCGNCNRETVEKDYTLEAQKIVSCIHRMGRPFGAGTVAEVLIGSRSKKLKELGFDKLSTYHLMPEYTKNDVVEIIERLIQHGYILRSPGQYPVVTLSETAMELLDGTPFVVQTVEREKSKGKKSAHNAIDVPEERSGLIALLREFRNARAQERKLPPYIIFSDATMNDLARRLPKNEEELLQVTGIGEAKLQTMGEDLLNLIEEVLTLFPEWEPIVPVKEERAKRKKDQASPTELESHRLYAEGHWVSEIAKIRGLSPRTVFSHLAGAYEYGHDLKIREFVSQEREKQINAVIDEIGFEYLRPIKDRLPDDVEYDEIRICVASRRRAENEKTTEGE